MADEQHQYTAAEVALGGALERLKHIAHDASFKLLQRYAIEHSTEAIMLAYRDMQLARYQSDNKIHELENLLAQYRSKQAE